MSEELSEVLQSLGTTSVWSFLAALLVVVVAYPVGKYARRLTKRWFSKLETVPDAIVDDISQAAQWLIWLVAAAVALALMGVSVGWISLAVVLTVIVVVLMIRPMVKNTAAGLVLTARPAFSSGDIITVDTYTGTVKEITSHSTVIQKVDGDVVHIPNSVMLDQTLEIHSAHEAIRSEFELSVDSKLDTAEVCRVLTDALKATDGLVKDPPPDAVGQGFEATGVVIRVRFWYPADLPSDAIPRSKAVQAVNAALVAHGYDLSATDIAIDSVPASQAESSES